MAFWVVLLSLLLLLLFKKLSSLALCGGRRLQDERAELEWLQRTLTLLRARLRDAEQGEIKDESLVLWLQELKDVACDVEDVIDELEYEELRQRVEGGSSTCCLPPLNKSDFLVRGPELSD
uniref:Putative disease resistance protein RGA4 n=1 Tax=Anthurium amnicola TaxID=1678845 RepID=A0A1D1XXU8_9ARAE